MPTKTSKIILSLLLIFGLFITEVSTYAEGNFTSGVSLDDEHFRLISDVSSFPMQIEIYDQKSGQPSVTTVLGSDYIPVSSTDYVQIICGSQSDSSSLRGGEFYVYFYDHDKKLTWDILDYVDSGTGERNRVSIDFLRELNGFQFVNIPDGYYIRIASANGFSCQLLIWDGCKSGYPINAQTSVFNSDTKVERLPEEASACIFVPESALYLIAKPGYTFLDVVSSNKVEQRKISSADIRFPAQVVYLRGFGGAARAKNVRIVKDYNYETDTHANDMPIGDLSEAVVAIDEAVFRTTTSLNPQLDQLYLNIQACMDFSWEAKADIIDNWGITGTGGVIGTFHEGITYHGIPYRSSWGTNSSVGWHVSKQTFMNAANDPDSIFYHTPNTEKSGPYYSLVCSSFGTLVSGFPYPMTNFSMMKDPELLVEKREYPVVGKLMSNGHGHCIVPTALSTALNDSAVMTLAEQIGPITTVQNVYQGIPKAWKGLGLRSAYPATYVYSVSAKTFSDIPYNITSYTIKNGSARPYRGDQSVYTSAMDVLINIKDPEATRLYYQQLDVTCSHGLPVSITRCDKPYYIDIDPGTPRINLRSSTLKDNTFTGVPLENGAIYGVWASKGTAQDTAPNNVEFFEWYDLSSEKVLYTVSDGALVTDSEFWYAIANAANETNYIKENKKSGYFSIPYHPPVQTAGEAFAHSDYSDYAERAQIASTNDVKAFFRKGAFGAYTTSKEIIEN